MNTGPPAVVEFPVIVEDLPGLALFSKLGPWRKTRMIGEVCGRCSRGGTL